MNKKKVILLIIFIFMLVVPFNVKAADISYGSCIESYGSIRLSKTGSNNDIGGKILGDVKKVSGDTAEFYANVQAGMWQKITNVNYTITDNDGNSCTGTVSGKDLDENNGSALLYFSVDKDTVKSLTISGKSNHDNVIDSISLDVQSKVSEYESLLEQGAIFSGDIMNKTPLECDQTITDTIRHYWKYVIILAPILLIVMCTIDFIKAVMTGDSDAMQKSSSNAFKRAIAMIILLFLPTILTIIFTWVGLENSLCF